MDGVSDDLFIDETALLRSVEGYFLVNAAYKRLFDIDRTEPPKVAALSALCFSGFRPIRKRQGVRLKSQFSAFANQLLAVQWAGVVFDQDFGAEVSQRLRSAGTLRLFKLLRGAKLNALEPYMSDMRRDPPLVGQSYDVFLGDLQGDAFYVRNTDLALIEHLVLAFELMWDRRGAIWD